MAKGKDGGGNNYTPIKNPELRPGQKETKTISELAQSKGENFKKDDESFVGQVKRTSKEKPPFSDRLNEQRGQLDAQKDKAEPEKDKE